MNELVASLPIDAVSGRHDVVLGDQRTSAPSVSSVKVKDQSDLVRELMTSSLTASDNSTGGAEAHFLHLLHRVSLAHQTHVTGMSILPLFELVDRTDRGPVNVRIFRSSGQADKRAQNYDEELHRETN